MDDNFNRFDCESNFDLDNFVKNFAYVEPPDLNSYISGGGKAYARAGWAKQLEKQMKDNRKKKD